MWGTVRYNIVSASCALGKLLHLQVSSEVFLKIDSLRSDTDECGNSEAELVYM